jgi:hypothetical protein
MPSPPFSMPHSLLPLLCAVTNTNAICTSKTSLLGSLGFHTQSTLRHPSALCIPQDEECRGLPRMQRMHSGAYAHIAQVSNAAAEGAGGGCHALEGGGVLGHAI